MNKLIVLAACVASMSAFAGNKLDIKQSEVKWVQPFGAKGPSLGFVEGKYGDKEPASFFVKFAAGGDSGWHFHNEDYQGVVLSGTFTEQQQGEKTETKLAAGTYFTQPAKIVHRNGCLKGAACLVYVHFAHGADSVITSADGTPVKQ